MSDLIQALEDTKLKFAQFGWSKAPSGDYGIYGQDGGNILRADNKSGERADEATVDYFTRNPNAPAIATIEEAFDDIPCAWYLNSVQFEEDSGYIHYEWIVQV